MLDEAVPEILFGGPLKSFTAVGPKLGGSGLPIEVGFQSKQRPASIAHVFPSWRKKLKGQIPADVRITKKLHPFKKAGFAGANSVEGAVEGVSRSPLVGCEPHLDSRRNDFGSSQPLAGRSREEGLVVRVSVVLDDSLH